MKEGEPRGRKRRLNLFISPELDRELRGFAQKFGLSEVDFTRHMLKLGLALYKAANDPEGGVYFREPGQEPEKIIPMI